MLIYEASLTVNITYKPDASIALASAGYKTATLLLC